jgi:hypothetical protein
MMRLIKAMLGIALVLVVVLIIMAVVVLPHHDDSSFHSNGKTILAGAVVCPDSVGARSEFHKGIQAAETSEKMEQQIKQQYGDPSSYDLMTNAIHSLPLVNFWETHKTDFSPYGCSELESGVPVYIENEDATGIATITVKLRDETLLHGITYAQEIKSDAKSGQ